MTKLHMTVFYNGRMICVESNPGFALRYWKRRRALDNRISWILREVTFVSPQDKSV